MKKYHLEIIVFICGAIVLILELVASRVLAPYVGTSIFVWSNLIGVILGSLSLGYWMGGKLADKNASMRSLAVIIFISSILIFISTLLKDVTLYSLHKPIADIKLRSLISSLLI